MELREYVKIIRKNLTLLIALATAFGMLAFFVSQQLPTTYTASLTFFVKRQATDARDDYYTFDGYYSQQAAEKFTETVVGFLQSKDILLASAKLADLPTDQESLEQLESSIKIKQVAPQLVSLQAGQGDGGEAKKFCTALAQATTERINLLNQTGDKAISVDLLNPEPLVEKNEPHAIVNTLVGILSGVLLSFLYTFLKEYLGG
jgi:capsular polysaccharide biosynthesis protein